MLNTMAEVPLPSQMVQNILGNILKTTSTVKVYLHILTAPFILENSEMVPRTVMGYSPI